MGLNPRNIGTDRLPLWQAVLIIHELIQDPHTYLHASLAGFCKRIPELWPLTAKLVASLRSGLGGEPLDLGSEFEKPLVAPAVTEQMLADRMFLSEGMGTNITE